MRVKIQFTDGTSEVLENDLDGDFDRLAKENGGIFLEFRGSPKGKFQRKDSIVVYASFGSLNGAGIGLPFPVDADRLPALNRRLYCDAYEVTILPDPFWDGPNSENHEGDTFLGTIRCETVGENPYEDVYLRPSEGEKEIVRRYGDNDDDYSSMPLPLFRTACLTPAWRLAFTLWQENRATPSPGAN
jgi:hypothetical protein